MKPPFKVPTGWDKGEPLTFHKVSESCFEVVRSGGYLATPHTPVSKESVMMLQFGSRNDMNEFLQWWDEPEHGRAKVKYLSPSEYMEFLDEGGLLRLRWKDVLPEMPDVLFLLSVKDKAQADDLNAVHARYVEEVRSILFPGWAAKG